MSRWHRDFPELCDPEPRMPGEPVDVDYDVSRESVEEIMHVTRAALGGELPRSCRPDCPHCGGDGRVCDETGRATLCPTLMDPF